VLTEAKTILSEFEKRHILVVGDLMLDEYIWGRVDRISPEAPVIVVDVESSESRPGGAANVANNLRALGAKVSIAGVVGEDDSGRALMSLMDNRTIDTSAVIVDGSRPTTKKTRIIAHSQQVVRVDHESKDHLPKEISSKLADLVTAKTAEVDAVLLSDYDKGVMAKGFVSRCVRAAGDRGLILIANPKPPNLRSFEGATVVMLNQSEARSATNERLSTLADVAAVGARLASNLGVSAVVVTCGAQGLVVCPAKGPATPLPAVPIEVYDVAGAGDTVISVLTLALACRADLLYAAGLANCAGGAVVQKVGVATVTTEEILEILKRAQKMDKERPHTGSRIGADRGRSSNH